VKDDSVTGGSLVSGLRGCEKEREAGWLGRWTTASHEKYNLATSHPQMREIRLVAPDIALT
jgi:hypothetical protein